MKKNPSKTVGEFGFCPTFIKAIDLGLPSNTKWANSNFGRAERRHFLTPGDTYQWGCTVAKSEFLEVGQLDKKTWDFTYYELLSPFADPILGRLYEDSNSAPLWKKRFDVAQTEWEGEWHIPSLEQWKELILFCEITKEENSRYCFLRFTSKINGEHILLPIVHYKKSEDGKFELIEGVEAYWSSTFACNKLAWAFFPCNIEFNFSACNAFQHIRPVWSKKGLPSR